MINTKRTQLRAVQRKQELHRLFAFTRRQLLEGKSAVFSNLYRRIEEERFQNEGVYLVKDLISCLHNHPQEENTYILIGNYLFDHKQALQWFIHPLTDRTESRYLQHHIWTLYLGVQISLQFYMSSKNPCYLQHIQELIFTATSIVQIMLDNRKRNKKSTSKDLEIWIFFLNLLSAVFDQRQAEIPSEAIQTFLEVLQTINFDQSRKEGIQKELSSIWICLKSMFRGNHDKELAERIISVSSGVFHLVLEHLPYERQDCLELIIDILSQMPGSYQAQMFSQKFISQLLYLMEQIPKLKPLIANILKFIIIQNNFDCILSFLNQGMHKLLTQSLKWALQQGNDNCLEDCLYALYQIMTKLNDARELRLLERVQNDIQLFSFNHVIEELWSKPRNERVTQLVCLITDDFYSEQTIEAV